jgi:hypothetical protein
MGIFNYLSFKVENTNIHVSVCVCVCVCYYLTKEVGRLIQQERANHDIKLANIAPKSR